MNTTPALPITPEPKATPAPTPEANAEPWQEFLEDDADCCGGCHHKPR